METDLNPSQGAEVKKVGAPRKGRALPAATLLPQKEGFPVGT